MGDHERVARLLLQSIRNSDADSDKTYDQTKIPTHLAVLKSAANETDYQGRTVLMLAVGTPGNLFDIFLGDGADPFLMDSQGRTCLHHAAARGSPEVVSKLLSKGLDPNLQDFDGWTPLFWAAKAGYRTNYKLLLDAGGNPRTKLRNGWTPRTVAIFHGNRRLIPLLDIPDGVQTESKVGVRRSLDEAHYAFPLKDTRTGVVEATLSTAVCDGCDLVSHPFCRPVMMIYLSRLSRTYTARATNAPSALISTSASNASGQPSSPTLLTLSGK